MRTELILDPDRLLPADPETRRIARDLFDTVAESPIYSPHGHVDPRILVTNDAFTDPTSLFITHDHYVTRLLHSTGMGLSELGMGWTPDDGAPSAREVWYRFCSRWHVFEGTASGYWLADELASLFGITEYPSKENSDRLFDAIENRLSRAEYRPRALFDRFRIAVLATTDDPLDSLDAHATLAADPGFAGRVLPTFRPDLYLDPAAPGWETRVTQLVEATSSPVSDYASYLDSLRSRRAYFIERGAVSADHGVLEPFTADLPDADAAALYDRSLRGVATQDEIRLFRANMLFHMARMSVEDGLVMTIHPGIYRNHHSETARRFGPDTGHDIPVPTSFVQNLRPVLERFGHIDDFHLVLFTVDEATYSREIAPLAGFYPSVYIGAPWWFLDAPDAVLRFRSAVTDTAGFYRGSGFIDDTRAFLSIPARHDMSRRLDASYLARLVREGRVSGDAAGRIIRDLVESQPRKVFKL